MMDGIGGELEMTASELVAFVKSKIGVPYVYGMKGNILSAEKYKELKTKYGNLIWDSDQKKIGKVCCDCSGLISWATGIQRSSQEYHDTAKQVYPIATIQQAPIGVAVWKKGHIGIYIGNGAYIAEDGSAYGCRQNMIAHSEFTHWFYLKDIIYNIEDIQNIPEKITMQINGKEYTITRILKNGYNFVNLRELSDILGYDIANQGSTPILKSRKA